MPFHGSKLPVCSSNLNHYNGLFTYNLYHWRLWHYKQASTWHSNFCWPWKKNWNPLLFVPCSQYSAALASWYWYTLLHRILQFLLVPLPFSCRAPSFHLRSKTRYHVSRQQFSATWHAKFPHMHVQQFVILALCVLQKRKEAMQPRISIFTHHRWALGRWVLLLKNSSGNVSYFTT